MTLAEFLGRLYERGELAQFLALLPVRTLEAWYQSLTVPRAEGPATRPEAGDHLRPATAIALRTPRLSSRARACPAGEGGRHLRKPAGPGNSGTP